MAALIAALFLVAPVTPAAADAPVTETATRVATVPEPDGTAVSLDVSLFTTDPSQPRPAIVLAHGFGGTKNDSRGPAETLARDGYAVITYTARGFGRSGGRIHLDDPAYEGADTTKLVDFAAPARRWPDRQPRSVIGFAGGSYGGAADLPRRGSGPAGRRDRAGVHLEQTDPVAVPAALVRTRPARRHAPVSLAGLTPADQAGVFKQRWARALRSAAGRVGRSTRARRSRRSAAGSTRRCARAICAPPSRGRPTAVACAARPLRSRSATRQGHRADPDHRRRERHPVPARPGRRQLPRAAGDDAARCPGSSAATTRDLGRRPAAGARDLVRPLPASASAGAPDTRFSVPGARRPPWSATSAAGATRSRWSPPAYPGRGAPLADAVARRSPATARPCSSRRRVARPAR